MRLVFISDGLLTIVIVVDESIRRLILIDLRHGIVSALLGRFTSFSSQRCAITIRIGGPERSRAGLRR